MPKRRSKGSGTVIQQGKTYRARIRANGRDLYGPARTTKRQAELDLHSHFFPAGGLSSIPQLVDFSRAQLEGAYGRSLAPATWATNSQIHEQFLNGQPIGLKRLDQITAATYQAWLDSFAKLSPHRLRRIHAYLRRLLGLAVRQGFLPSNPAFGAILPRTRPNLPELADLDRLAPVFGSDDPIDQIIAFAYLTGLRRSELVGLTWPNVDTKRKLLKVRQSKSAAGVRTVPLSDRALAILEATSKTSMLVFATQDGHKRSPSALTHQVRTRLDSLGVSRNVKPLHGARAAFITALYESGSAPHDTMALVGHTSPSVALRYYAATNQKRLAAAVAVAGESFLPKHDRVTDKGKADAEPPSTAAPEHP